MTHGNTERESPEMPTRPISLENRSKWLRKAEQIKGKAGLHGLISISKDAHKAGSALQHAYSGEKVLNVKLFLDLGLCCFSFGVCLCS